MKRIGVLISGRGSNLQALIDAERNGALGGTIAVVVSNVSGAPGLDKARAAGVPARSCPHEGRPREDASSRSAADAIWRAATGETPSRRRTTIVTRFM